MKKDPTGQIVENQGRWRSRLIVGTPVTGLVRIEWATSRYGQTIPTNWSMAEVKPWMSSVAPLRFLVADAQNIITQKCIEEDAEWMLLIEQDNIIPTDTFIRLNQYMIKKSVPMVSGLYFTKSVPPEPMIYRGRGTAYFSDWKMGDKVWCDGVPTGCLLIHASILKAIWNDSPEYRIDNMVVRRVFETPNKVWFDQDAGVMRSESGTSDLAFCTRVIKGKYLEKAGWPKLQAKKYPFLVDTNIFVRHIDDTGRQWPLEVPKEHIGGKGLEKNKVVIK